MIDLVHNDSNFELHESWQAHWGRHAKWLRTVLTARLNNGLVVDEVLQNVAIIAWEKRDQLSEESKMAPWLYRIAIRQVQLFWRTRLKNKERFVGLSDDDETEDETQSDPLAWIMLNESQEQVREAFRELPPQDREILLLKHTEGWSYQEISGKLGISIDKVIYRLSRARKRLRLKLLRLEKNWTQK